MGVNFITITGIALTIVAALPSTAAANEVRSEVAVPVSVDFGDYDTAHEAPQNAIDAKLLRSSLVTLNVDAYRSLDVAVRLSGVRWQRRRAVVTYSWDRKTIARMIFACTPKQIGRCSAAIVDGAERTSHIVRRSPSWMR